MSDLIIVLEEIHKELEKHTVWIFALIEVLMRKGILDSEDIKEIREKGDGVR